MSRTFHVKLTTTSIYELDVEADNDLKAAEEARRLWSCGEITHDCLKYWWSDGAEVEEVKE